MRAELTPYQRDALIAALLSIVLIASFFIAAPLRDALLVGAALLGTAPVVYQAVRSVRAREWGSMELLASVALLFSLATSAWASAVFIALMLAAARILADLTRSQVESSIRSLLKLKPQTALIERGESLVTVPVDAVQVGEIVHVRISERVPVDGTVLRGEAAIDESTLTGESLPVDVREGSQVYSSTLVASGSLVLRATRVGKDTTLERVIALVEASRAQKPVAETMGERFGRIYLLVIFFGSAVLLGITHDTALVLAVVLVVCADDVAVAVPITYLRAIRAAARRGIIVKSARHLERFGSITTIVFDKTGTLTTGILRIASVVAPHGDRERVLREAARAAVHSRHPLSRAILDAVPDTSVSPADVKEFGGRGIVVTDGADTIALGKEALFIELGIEIPENVRSAAVREAGLGRSVSFVSVTGAIIGALAAEDRVKDNASAVIEELRALGIVRTVLLTGDNERVGETVRATTGIDRAYANLLPEDKVRIISELEAEGPVAMVGDGINDAAALARSSVGIAMGGLGAEGTIESAELVVMRDNLDAIPYTLRLARSANRIARQDFYIWGATNAFGLALVAIGYIGPQGAALYNFLTDFLPLGNALRVR
ncbi:cation-translocating P-type ATPase [Patescibacteria group bacterium]|nr:cation-translocating P-type ATPase [Patescibacteria group bacterium]